jgi:hypothetical protein
MKEAEVTKVAKLVRNHTESGEISRNGDDSTRSTLTAAKREREDGDSVNQRLNKADFRQLHSLRIELECFSGRESNGERREWGKAMRRCATIRSSFNWMRTRIVRARALGIARSTWALDFGGAGIEKIIWTQTEDPVNWNERFEFAKRSFKSGRRDRARTDERRDDKWL